MHKKLVILAILILSIAQGGFAQTYKISGVIEDTLGNALIQSTVLLLEKADSTLVEFTQTGMDGAFQFKKIQPGQHLVKATYLGFLPLTVDASSTDGSNVNLGTLQMTEIAEELMEVVIKAAKAPIKMRGDTIEYDASTFQVPQGSTVEDLLRRLPGIEVESDGSINADGKAVDKVTVDGKKFFGSDPKAATKNLPAEGISKVQVFDTKTEEQKITGSTEESENKTMNLELKEEFKAGGFGKVIASVGNESRKELKGNYNKFNKKIQFSIVGVGNNTGRNGLSWDDYQDFMGSESWNFGEGNDYGFGGRGGFHTFYLGGGDGGIEQSISNLFFSGEESGFPENYSAGINFNYDHNKTKFSSVYYYNQNSLLQNTDRDQDKFFQAFTQNDVMSSRNDATSQGHRVELSFEKELDTMHTVVLEVDGAYIDDNNIYNGNSSLSKDELLTSQSNFQNNTNTVGGLFNATGILRKKFKRKGRRMGFNASYLITSLEDDWLQKSSTNFFDDQGMIDSTFINDQDNVNLADKTVFKANLLFVEPISKKFFLQSFVNYRDRNENGDRTVEDINNDQRSLNENLSRIYDNNIKYNRTGTALRYSNNGLNLAIGGAYQYFNLAGEYRAVIDQSVLGIVDKSFSNFIPHLSAGFSPKRNFRLNVSFSRQANEPSIKDLAPLVDNINPLFIRTGNEALEPELENRISLRVHRSFPLHDLRISFNGSYSFFDKQFSTEEFVDDNLITTSRPINVDDGRTGTFNVFVNFPIIKNKIKLRTSYRFRQNQRTSLVNTIENQTTVITHTPNLKVDITPSQHFTIYLASGVSNSNTVYDLNSTQDQKVKRTNFSAEVNAKLVAGVFLSTTLDYSRYTNDRFNQDTTIPILNTSIYKHFLPDNQLELRIALYDGFNRNVGFNQSAYGISVTQSTVESLGRYGLLSITYNIRGMKTDVRKKGWW